MELPNDSALARRRFGRGAQGHADLEAALVDRQIARGSLKAMGAARGIDRLFRLDAGVLPQLELRRNEILLARRIGLQMEPLRYHHPEEHLDRPPRTEQNVLGARNRDDRPHP